MAILRVTAELIAGLVFDQALTGRCLGLARQDVRLTLEELVELLARVGARSPSRTEATAAALQRAHAMLAHEGGAAQISDRMFFRALGFDETRSVDVSAFEQADHIHDLNTPGLAAKLPGPVDFALETGTAEHVFHIPNYLRNIGEVLAPGGVALHIVPAHGFMDHGFYQFSPTLFLDYYSANRFDLLDLVLITTDTDDWSRWRIQRYEPGEFDRADRSRFRDRYVVVAVAARKRADSTSDAIPQQRIYSASEAWRQESAKQVIAGTRDLGALHGPFHHDQGFCWRAELAPDVGPADTVQLAMRSQLVLCEDARPLGPAHAPHASIRTHGAGGYSHWDGELLFSTSDNSDPNENGRRYSVRARDSSSIVGIFDTTDGLNRGGARNRSTPAGGGRGMKGLLRDWFSVRRR